MNIKLTIFFDDPFWVGVFERIDEGMLETSRVVLVQNQRTMRFILMSLKITARFASAARSRLKQKRKEKSILKGFSVSFEGRLQTQVLEPRHNRL